MGYNYYQLQNGQFQGCLPGYNPSNTINGQIFVPMQHTTTPFGGNGDSGGGGNTGGNENFGNEGMGGDFPLPDDYPWPDLDDGSGNYGGDGDDGSNYYTELPRLDCANVIGGNAYRDKCYICVGGITGKLPCSKTPCELANEQINKTGVIDRLKELHTKAGDQTHEWGS